MIILGVNCAFHDSTACIVKDGELLIAIEEERLTRNKHSTEFPVLAIKRCLKESNIDYDEIDHIAISVDPSLYLARKFGFYLSNPKSALSLFRLTTLRLYWRYRTISKWYKNTWNGFEKRPVLHYISHHESHLSGSFLVSPYKEAALLSLDGAGEWATSLLGMGSGQEVKFINQTYFPHSLGYLYAAITSFCGFKPDYDEGKTMGLAPFGDADRFYKDIESLVTVSDDGDIKIELSYFNYQYGTHDYLSKKFIDKFGHPRSPVEEFEQHHMDVAAAFQKLLEEAALKLCAVLRKKTNAEYLVIAGGVALNSVMNGRIVRESGFKDIYVMPAAGDNGTAIGAAYCVYNQVLGNPRNFTHLNPYVGTEYSNDYIKSVLDECKLSYRYTEEVEAETAGLLQAGNIVCWFQGKMEIGPRALGCRSILADPTDPKMKDKINSEVKHREAYRPFAPSVPVESMREYFDIEVEAPFMLKVCDVKQSAVELLPAITHVDGSARVQSVRRETNPRYHKLLEEFGLLSGVPVLLNTSFNIMGEPIVESPYHAIRCFFSTGLDYLVIGDFIVSK